MTKAVYRPLLDEHRQVLDTASLDELAMAKRWLLSRDQKVTKHAVAEAVLAARSREARWTALRAEEAEFRLEADRVGRRAAEIVAKCLDKTGKAPTWRELGRVLGWQERQIAPRIKYLRQLDWLRAGVEARSLRPGAKAALNGKERA